MILNIIGNIKEAVHWLVVVAILRGSIIYSLISKFRVFSKGNVSRDSREVLVTQARADIVANATVG